MEADLKEKLITSLIEVKGSRKENKTLQEEVNQL